MYYQSKPILVSPKLDLAMIKLNKYERKHTYIKDTKSH